LGSPLLPTPHHLTIGRATFKALLRHYGSTFWAQAKQLRFLQGFSQVPDATFVLHIAGPHYYRRQTVPAFTSLVI
jgi:hypothetical protein